MNLSTLDTSALIERLQAQASTPDDVDQLCEEFGAPSHLFNFFLSISIDVPGLGQGVYVPRMISTSRGGRSSGLQLEIGNETLLGVHVNGNTCGMRHWTRLSGESEVLKEGDRIRERWTTLSGSTISDGEGEVTEINFGSGRANLRFNIQPSRLGIGDINIPDTKCECDAVVILWTLICWADCECKPAKVSVG